MRKTLFIKIFFWYWFCIIVIIAIVAFVVLSQLGGMLGSEWRILADKTLSLYGQTAVKIYEEKGANAFVEYVNLWEKGAPDTVFLFRDMKELTGRAASQQIEQLVRKAERTKKDEILSAGGVAFVATSIDGGGGRQFVLVVKTEKKGYFKEILNPSRFIVFKVTSILIASALACFALSYSLTSSIRKLRDVTQRFAKGDLTSRALPVFGKRDDEFSDLATDFDRMAERIEDLMTSQKQLLANISHELRSPLARLNVALDLCQSQAEKPQQHYLQRIEKETLRLDEMIGQLLDLSRFETGVIEMKAVPIDLIALAREVIEDANFEAKSRDSSVKLIASGPCTIYGAPQYIRSALENVIRNALRFTPKRSEVEVSVEFPVNDAKATVLVRDHGPGVPDAALEKIFKPFYRVEDDRDGQNGGTGLGLAITEKILQFHGGSVRAYNAEGGGLAVEITIPSRV